MKNNKFKLLSTTIAITTISFILLVGINIQGNAFASDSKKIQIANENTRRFYFQRSFK